MRKIPPNDLPWTGERYVTQLKGDIELEHKHRYALACELSKGKRVLDIACGEGYGSEMLSRRAKSVVGVDIDPATVAHAIKKYHSPKMRFLEGACEKIPLPDKSVDLVVSFETLEHFEDHNKFFREIERVLDSSGILVISTPEKAAYSDKPTYVNPFHKKELNREQFLQLLSQNYSNMTYFEQKVTGGSWLVAPKDRTMGFLSFHLNEQVGGISSRNGLKDALYIVAVCSNAPLPALAGSMYEAEFWVGQGMQDLSNQFEQQEKRAIEKNNLAKPKPGFWRRLEQSIRKRRKRLQAVWGFDACWYLETNPDVKEAGVDPLQHYLQYGIPEGRRKSKKDHPTSVKPSSSVAIEKYLPSVRAAWRPPADLSVMVVVPVYKGKEETQRCIRSLLRNTDDIPAEILVINDDSPDAELVGWLEEVAADGKIKLIRNEKNLGFVASANRGMAWAGLRDIILLNSDTEVPSGWMKRLASHAYSAEKIGTVTPFSNNATICSWPTHQGGDLPGGRSVDEIDAAFREGNSGRQVTIPTGVGFCMYLRRTCLDEVGLFDEISFGRGYGEENDFCMRALKAGWKHLLACDLFVAHAGARSFGKSAPELSKAWETVYRLHPNYPHLIAEHIQTDEVSPYRFAAIATLFRKAAEPTILLVSHNWGGGTQRHVNELVKVLGRSANVLLLQGDPSGVKVTVPSLPGHPHMILGSHEVDKLHALLCSFGVDRVHIHHWIDLKFNLRELIQKLKVPFDLTLHDYYSICPQITLMKQRNRPYCGEPDEKECNACIQENPHNGAILHGAKSIAEWRNDSHWMLNEAKRVICPSADVKNRMARYAPQANFIVAPHENVVEEMWCVARPKITQNQKIRIGLIGWLSPHKGWENVVETVSRCDPERYEFIHIGYSDPELPIQVGARVHQIGRYEEADLSRLIQKEGLHLAWFPAIWPETYSYTLSAAIEAALPIVAPKVGAFPERLHGRPLTWVVESYQKPDEWLKVFEKVRSTFISDSEDAAGRRVPTGTPFYPEEYLKPALKKQAVIKKTLRHSIEITQKPKNMAQDKVHVFTSAAWNYLPKVRLLFQSLRRFHPEWELHWILADRMREEFDLSKEPFDEICELEDLGIPNWMSWVFRHSLVELSTAIKPYMLAKLLKRQDCKKVIYLDPDIVVFSKLNDIIDSLDEHHVVLTPHQAMPEKVLEGVIDQEICSLKYGIYNLGFLGVANTGIGNQFANWWSERLYNFCRDDIPNGLFTDQRWCDLVPALFSGIGILRESRFNVSTWNITNREMTLTESGQYLVDGKPLGFYHFTGFDSGAHKIMAVKNGGSNIAMRRLIDWYQNETACSTENAYYQSPWFYGFFSNGAPIAPQQRIVYRERKDLQNAFPNPFDSETYLAWWNTHAKKEYPELLKVADQGASKGSLNEAAPQLYAYLNLARRITNFIKATYRNKKGYEA